MNNHSIKIFNNHGLIALAFTALLASSAQGAVLAAYDFGPSTGHTFGATTVASGLSGSDITEGNMAVYLINDTLGYPTPLNPVIQVSPPNNSTGTIALAVANNSYFSFTITPDASSTLDLSSLAFNSARGGGGTPRGYAVRSSVDSFASDLSTNDVPTVRPTWTNFNVDLSAAAFDNITTSVEFRVYVYTPSTGNTLEFDDITLNGDVSAIPEPSSALLMGLSSLGLMLRRRS